MVCLGLGAWGLGLGYRPTTPESCTIRPPIIGEDAFLLPSFFLLRSSFFVLLSSFFFLLFPRHPL
jgi:hypothetical protein